MGIYRLPMPQPSQTGVVPNLQPMVTSDSLSTITTAGYLNPGNLMGFSLSDSNVLQVFYNSLDAQGTGSDYGFFQVQISAGIITLHQVASGGELTPPIVIDAGTNDQNSLVINGNVSGEYVAEYINNNNVISGSSVALELGLGTAGINLQAAKLNMLFTSSPTFTIRVSRGGTSTTFDNPLTIVNVAGVLTTTIGNSAAVGNVTNILGVTNANVAPAGMVGEFVTSSVASGSAVALTSTTGANVTSISLTAGDWEIWGGIGFVAAATTTMTLLAGSIGSGTGALVAPPNGGASFSLPAAYPTNAATPFFSMSPLRVNITATTIYYLVAQATFAVSTCGAFGAINARRIY